MQRLILITIIFLLIACGGGSTGTGDAGTLKLQAVIKDQNQLAIAGVTIQSELNGAETISDENGFFEIDLITEEGNASLTFVLQEKQTSIELTKLDASTNNAVAVFRLNSDNFSVSIESIDVVDSIPIATSTPVLDHTKPTPTATPSQERVDTKSKFRGTVKVANFGDYPLSGVSVEIDRNNLSDKTDNRGYFEIETPIISGDIKLILKFPGDIQKSVKVPSIPNRAVIITLRINVELDFPNDVPSEVNSPKGGRLPQNINSSDVSVGLGSVRIK